MAVSQKNFESPEDMPIDLQLDLLVDEELPDQARRALLKSLDHTPGRWRDLSIRFLQRQVENKALRQLLAGKAAEISQPQTQSSNMQIRRWLTPTRYFAVAAGLLIVTTSALIVLHFADHATSNGVAKTEGVTPPSSLRCAPRDA